MKKYLIITCIFFSSTPLFAKDTLFGLFLIPQLGAGHDYEGGVAPRYGLTAQIGPTSMADGVAGMGILFGVVDAPRPRIEIGAGFVGMYMGSVLLQGATRWSLDKEFAGAHATAGLGFIFFLAYLRAGYDSLEKSAVFELGAIVPLPVNKLLGM